MSSQEAGEKEEQRILREQLREEEKRQKEIEAKKLRIAKEETHFAQRLTQITQQLGSAVSEETHQALVLERAKIEEALVQIEIKKADVLREEQNTRAGYVYIISNVGTFGEEIYKIGVTRCLEPRDRIYELGDASVPFHFDIHALIFSEDAPALENALHKAFERRRLNMINRRREFFKVSLQEIEQVVSRHALAPSFTDCTVHLPRIVGPQLCCVILSSWQFVFGKLISMRDSLAATVRMIQPYDRLEADHIRDTLRWIATGAPLCRIQKPATPPRHLVAYFVVLDRARQQLLLVDHRKAGLWLPSGGHVEPGEHPHVTVEREVQEELQIAAEFLFSEPIFLTVTQTVGATAGHTDVSLWYVLLGDSTQPLQFDHEEFVQIRWFPIQAVPLERTEPHLTRFTAKLLHRLGQ